MNQRFDMIWFGRMGLNHEGKTATQGCEAKQGGPDRNGPNTHFLALYPENSLRILRLRAERKHQRSTRESLPGVRQPKLR